MSVWSYVFSSSLPSKTEVFSFRFHFPFPSMLWNLIKMLVQICKATIRCCQQLLHKLVFTWCGFEKNFLKMVPLINIIWIEFSQFCGKSSRTHVWWSYHKVFHPPPRICEDGCVHGQVTVLLVCSNQMIWGHNYIEKWDSIMFHRRKNNCNTFCPTLCCGFLILSPNLQIISDATDNLEK